RLPEAFVIAAARPPIQGLSMTGGVEGYLEVRGDAYTEEIHAIASRVMNAANQRPELVNARTTLDISIPRYHAEVDRDKALAAGVPVGQVFQAMQATFGSMYINDFTLAGRNWQVNLQSEGEFRNRPEDLDKVFARSDSGELVPL